MSDSREKLRAVFLAFVMVTSVMGASVAFTGSVAADGTPNTTTEFGSDNSVSPGETIRFNNITVNGTAGPDHNITKISVFNSSNALGANNITKVEVFNNSTRTNSLGTNTSITNIGTSNSAGIDVPINGSQGINVSNGVTFRYDVAVTFNTSSIVNSTDIALQTQSFNSTGTGSFISTPAVLTTTQTDVGTSSSSLTLNDNARSNVNVSITTPADSVGVNESSIDLSVSTDENSVNGTDVVQVIRNGQIVNGTDNGTNFDAGGDVQIDVDVALPDSDGANYDLQLGSSVTDDGGNVITSGDGTGDLIDSQGSVDMEPAQMVINSADPVFANTDGNTPASSDENATIQVFSVDKFNNPISDEREVNATVTLTDGGDDSVTVQADNANPGVGNKSQPYNFTVSDTEIGTASLTAFDSDSSDTSLNSVSTTQRFTGSIGGVSVSFNRSNLPTDGTVVKTTAQLVDSNGNAVPVKDVSVGLSFNNGGSAGVNVVDQSQSQTTNANGVATFNITASNTGVALEAIALENKNGNTGNATIQTVAGSISTSNSNFLINGNDLNSQGTEVTDKVATQHDLSVRVLDSGGSGNAVPDQTVTYTLNGSQIASKATDSNGYSNVTITLPQQKGDYVLNASAGAFNASATSEAQLNITANAENITALQFNSPQSSVAPKSQNNKFTVEAVDQYNNVNVSTGSLGQVTLASSDQTVLDFSGTSSNKSSLSSGTANFEVDANGTGTATLTATIPDPNITNTSTEVSVANPAGINLTVDHNLATDSSTNSNEQKRAVLTAQFVDSSGSSLGIDNTDVTFVQVTGNSAVLNTSPSSTVANTGGDGNGNATFGINATSNLGTTTFRAINQSFGVQGSVTVQTTGTTQNLNVAPSSSAVTANQTTNVTVSFVDSNGDIVPRNQTVDLSAANGTIESQSSKSTTINSNNEYTATFTYNATGGAGSDTITATTSSGNFGEAAITVEEDAPAYYTLTLSHSIADRTAQTTTISTFFTYRQSGSTALLPRNVYRYTRTHTGGQR